MKYVVLAAAAAVLAGCATPPVYDPVLPYEPDQHAVSHVEYYADSLPDTAVGLDVPINYSAMSNAINSAQYSTPYASPGTAAAGGMIAILVIAAVDASIDANRNSRIDDMLVEQGLDAEAFFNSALVAELEEDGLRVSYNTAERDRGGEISGAGNSADAVLNIEITHYGFELQGVWQPMVIANIELVATRSGEVLLSDQIRYGVGNWNADIAIAPADHRYLFASVDAIVEDQPERARAAIEFALLQTARRAAQLLRN